MYTNLKMVGRWTVLIKQVLGLQTPKGFERHLSDIPKVARTTKKVRRRKKKATEDSEEAHTLAHAPPKLIFPFTGTNNEIEKTKTSKTKQQDPPDAFVTKEDSLEGRYYLFESCDQEQYRLPSVTTVLQSTMPSSSWFGLHQWRKGMIEEHGEKEYKRIRNETIRSGTLFHQLLEERLKSRTHPTKPSQQTDSGSRGNTIQSIDGSELMSLNSEKGSTTSSMPAVDQVTGHGVHYESVKNILADISDVMVTEGVVRHEQLGYSGTVDCVARYKGELCVIDWKTSNKPKPQLKDLHDYPLQVMAYAGALNSDPKYDFKVHRALIVVAYSTGCEADSHWLDEELCLQYWDNWLDRLNQFQTQFAHDLTDIYL